MSILSRASAWARGIFAQPRTELQEPGPRVVFLPRSEAGVYMSPDEALKISAVWACVTVIAKSIAACEWEVLEELQNGNRELRNELQTYRLLNVRPNPEMTAFAFREAMLISVGLWGNAYAEIERTDRGTPVGLWPLAPDRCSLERGDRGFLQLRVYNQFQDDTILPYRDVLHFQGPSLDGISGLDRIAYAARSLGHAAALEIFGATFFGNGTQVGGILSPEHNLTPEQVNQIIESLQQRHQGPQNAHKFLVLRGGIKFQPLTVQPNHAQFVESRQHMIEEVCRWYGVPPHKIAHLLRSTFNNIEHQGLEFVRDTFTPIAEPMAQEANYKLLPFGNRALFTRIDLDWLSEGDAKTRAEEDAVLVGHGLRTVNEVRRKRGENTAGPEADVLRTQAQYVPLGSEPAEPDPVDPANEPAISQEET